MKNNSTKRKKRRSHKQEFQQAPQLSLNDANSLNNLQENKHQANVNGRSQTRHNNGQQQTTGQISDNSLPIPYQFLKLANPPLHTIFVPHFTVKSVNFALTIVFVITFIILLIYNYIKHQTEITWNCSLYQLQNKYFPKIRYNYQIWRVLVSGIFHSNIPHFILNLFGLQIYGYFIEWYYGKIKYTITAVISVIIAHFMGCIAEGNSISTMPSAILYSFLALKLYFFYEYWDYRPLLNRKVFIIILYCLIMAINIIPVLVSNNVDYSSIVGGFVSGLILGMFYYARKREQKVEDIEQLHRGLKVAKWMMPILLAVLFLAFVIITFVMDSADFRATNDAIDEKCRQQAA